MAKKKGFSPQLVKLGEPAPGTLSINGSNFKPRVEHWILVNGTASELKKLHKALKGNRSYKGYSAGDGYLAFYFNANFEPNPIRTALQKCINELNAEARR